MIEKETVTRVRSKKKKRRKAPLEPKKPQCGKYLSHKWGSSVKGNICDEMLALKCLRCSTTFSDVYQMRKDRILQKYRDKINAR